MIRLPSPPRNLGDVKRCLTELIDRLRDAFSSVPTPGMLLQQGSRGTSRTSMLEAESGGGARPLLNFAGPYDVNDFNTYQKDDIVLCTSNQELDNGTQGGLFRRTVIALDTAYFTAHYNTDLTDEQEEVFQTWASGLGALGRLANYDLRGFYLTPAAETWNGTDVLPLTYAKPNGADFSTSSIYNNSTNPQGFDPLVGGHWLDATTFYISPTQMDLAGWPASWDYWTAQYPSATLTWDEFAHPRPSELIGWQLIARGAWPKLTIHSAQGDITIDAGRDGNEPKLVIGNCTLDISDLPDVEGSQTLSFHTDTFIVDGVETEIKWARTEAWIPA